MARITACFLRQGVDAILARCFPLIVNLGFWHGLQYIGFA